MQLVLGADECLANILDKLSKKYKEKKMFVATDYKLSHVTCSSAESAQLHDMACEASIQHLFSQL